MGLRVLRFLGFGLWSLGFRGFVCRVLGYRALAFGGFASRQVIITVGPFFASRWLNLYTVQPMGGKGPPANDRTIRGTNHNLEP